MDETDHDAVARLRATAHPVRLRILSLLTAEAMSAAEVARTLEITHANASYHLRQLHDVGELVVESEEKIRGGVAKRYRYDASRERRRPLASRRRRPDRLRPRHGARGGATPARRGRRAPASSSDLEAWVPVEAWRRALDLLHEASHLLHAEARPAGTPETVHVSATHQRLHDDRRARGRRRPLDARTQEERPMTWADVVRAPRATATSRGTSPRASSTPSAAMMANIALTFAVLDIDGRGDRHRQVLAAHTIPMVVLLLWGGVISDRLPRARGAPGRPTSPRRSPRALIAVLVHHRHAPRSG